VVTSGQRGKQALDHAVLELVTAEAVLVALLRPIAVPREAHVVRVLVRVALRGGPSGWNPFASPPSPKRKTASLSSPRLQELLGLAVCEPHHRDPRSPRHSVLVRR